MATHGVIEVIRHLRRSLPDRADETDGLLLDRFIEQRDQAAFAALVRRHGPMVLGVCRRILRDPHDAEDAFQATFLVLVRKAASVVPRAMVANWLHGVARQTAIRVRVANLRRQSREKLVTTMPEPEAVSPAGRDDLRPLLDQELGHLPEKYRVPVVLCDLEGLTRKEAARRLGWPEGSVSSRLARGRAMLARRLVRQGVVPSAAGLATVLAGQAAAACVPLSLVVSTVEAAGLFAAGEAAAGLVTARVADLVEGVVKAMLLTKFKLMAAVVLVLGTVGFACGLLAGGQTLGQGPNAERIVDGMGDVAAAPVRDTAGGNGGTPEDRTAERLQEAARDNKPRVIEGIVAEVDGDSILLTSGELVLLDEKTEYLLETGLDGTRGQRSDVRKGKEVAIGIRPGWAGTVANSVFIRLFP
jgi:RNA polymerase sigma factor (sigma-70 family)